MKPILFFGALGLLLFGLTRLQQPQPPPDKLPDILRGAGLSQSTPPATTPPAAPTPSHAGIQGSAPAVATPSHNTIQFDSVYTTRPGAVFCATKQELRRGLELSDDAAAFREFMANANCGSIEPGTAVHVEEGGHYLRLRPVGRSISVYALRTAILPE